MISVSLSVLYKTFFLVLLFGTHSSVFSFCLMLCVSFYTVDEAVTSSSLKELASFRRSNLLFNPALVLGCLSNLSDCLSNLFYF